MWRKEKDEYTGKWIIKAFYYNSFIRCDDDSAYRCICVG